MSAADLAVEPVAVWDVRDFDWWRNWKLKSAWLQEQGLPADSMYRAEFYLIDGPCARIFCHALNGDGRKYPAPGHEPGEPHDHAACRPAEEEPRMVLLSDLPPAELR